MSRTVYRNALDSFRSASELGRVPSKKDISLAAAVIDAAEKVSMSWAAGDFEVLRAAVYRMKNVVDMRRCTTCRWDFFCSVQEERGDVFGCESWVNPVGPRLCDQKRRCECGHTLRTHSRRGSHSCKQCSCESYDERSPRAGE